jgi:hypothetical protein
MSDFDDEEVNEEVDDDENGPSGLRKRLRRAEREVKEANERASANEAAAKRVAFLDAEIPDTPQTKFFREKYDGELTAEAIRSSASTYGFVTDTDHTEELGEVASQSDASFGAEGPTVLGSQEEMMTEMDKAARDAPRGQESRAIADVVARYTRSPI